MSQANTTAPQGTDVPVALPDIIPPSPSSKGQATQTSTSTGASSQSPQSSPSSSSSNIPVTTTTTATKPDPSDSATNSPVASSSNPFSSSIPLASSTPSETQPPNSTPNDPSITLLTTTSALPTQALAPSPSQSSSTRAVSFLQNKPVMIATFASAGVFVLVVVLILGTIVLRRKRRNDLIDSALDFSITTEHLVSGDNNDGGGGGDALISRSSDSLTSMSRGTRPRVASVNFGTSPYVPAPALAPVSVPASVHAPREIQQHGFGTGYINGPWLDRGETANAMYTYGNSAQPYYDTVRKQQPRPPPPSQHQLQYQPQYEPQQQPRPRWQEQEERPLPLDLPLPQQQQMQYLPQQQPRPLRQQQEERPLPPDLPTDVGFVPLTLVPSFQRDNAMFDVPFATAASRLSTVNVGTGGVDRSRSEKRERRKSQQAPLPPPPRYPRTIPGRNDESPEDIDEGVVDDRRNQSRVLKVVNG